MQARMLYTVEQAREQLAIGRTRFFDLIRGGEIESVKIGNSRRVPHEALVAYVEHLRNH